MVLSAQRPKDCGVRLELRASDSGRIKAKDFPSPLALNMGRLRLGDGPKA